MAPRPAAKTPDGLGDSRVHRAADAADGKRVRRQVGAFEPQDFGARARRQIDHRTGVQDADDEVLVSRGIERRADIRALKLMLPVEIVRTLAVGCGDRDQRRKAGDRRHRVWPGRIGCDADPPRLRVGLGRRDRDDPKPCGEPIPPCRGYPPALARRTVRYPHTGKPHTWRSVVCESQSRSSQLFDVLLLPHIYPLYRSGLAEANKPRATDSANSLLTGPPFSRT